MSFELVSKSSEQTRSYGYQIASILLANDVLLLSGDLGAGKTEFTKGIAEGLSVDEPVNSPTFNLLMVHELAAGPEALPPKPHALYHFDLYRLDDSSQLEDLDYFGLLEDGGLSVVEWGDRFPEALPLDFLHVRISILDDNTRQLQFASFGKRSQQRLTEWMRLCAQVPDD
ncbi:MAG: tRNA (adenosine(37)-N6)-threonylcarbamoyltransferase complex ATPase subunit type 1 TsaE [Coriobacteriia bacterium]|nr:tRNA (adenosine(37)-N6)-threonylcarbamoyltransferase complex ATPase subunit type 1 TsaE [Coriobacteriia bacterium]